MVPLSQIKATFPVLKNPANRHRAVGFTHEQWHYAFTNTFSEEESRALYERYHIPASGSIFWGSALANIHPGHDDTYVDYHNDDRAPLLFISGSEDHLMPPRSSSRTRSTTSPTPSPRSRSSRAAHLMPAQEGWEEVADYALEWALEPRRAAEPGRVTAAGAARGFDVIVIGGGTGRTALRRASRRRRPAAWRSSSASCVGGECDYWACIPSKTLLRPGEALQAARDAPGAREAVSGGVRPEGAFEWRDFMVSSYEDGAKAAYLESKGIEVLRGSARLTGPGSVEVGEEAHSAEHVVIATGSDPVIPPVPGLGELDGVWTNREVTALTEVPRRLLVLGGGPVGVEMAQAVHGAWALPWRSSRARTTCSRASRSHSARRSAWRSPRTGSSSTSASTPPSPAARATSTCSSSPGATSFAATACSWRQAGVRAWTASASTRSAWSPRARGSPSTSGCAWRRASGRSAT